ncbi:Na(+)-translocating NADH-quinone reductase subunit A [Alistipes sp. OttesenSCG-928-B03]|nr:Na(+)-translocating NADH-quinone reductase subunit A [Alistipes sp. OttesenSCG-928-B03]
MSKVIKIRKGLDIKLMGKPERSVSNALRAAAYGISPSDFVGITPKLLVQEGERVEAGTPVFFDKKRPELLVCSPVSGTVAAVNRGDKRSIINVVIEADKEQVYRQFEVPKLKTAERGEVIASILEGGLWPCIMQRPYGIIANPDDTPKAVFVSGFDSAPLAPDMNFALSAQMENLRTGFAVLRKLSGGEVHLGLRDGDEGILEVLKPEGVQRHLFDGPHPAGNVGVQIAHIDPICKDDIVWTVDIQNVAMIGRFFNTGRLDMTKVYAVAGSEVAQPAYVSALVGAPVASLLPEENRKQQKDGDSIRYISGNVLTGKRVGADGYIGFYANQLTALPEGDKYELLGWAMPRFNKFSVARTYFSWLRPDKQYVIDTNINGGHRPFIVTGLFERYVPMDIYPMYLLKAILAGDIDKMENLGIYEVVEEDLALCEFVDPSKNEIQQMVRDGINLMIKELS